MIFETLIAELADPTKPLAASMLIGLSGMNPEEATLFSRAWNEFDDRKRERLISELVDLAEDNVELNFDPVFFIGLNDANAGVRRAALQGLWEHEGRALIGSLVDILDSDPEARVRAEAALALGRFVVKAELEALRGEDVERIDSALRRTITDPLEVPEVRARALESVGARSQGWVRDLVEDAYHGDDRRLRISAVHAMGRSCDASWLDAVHAELESEDPEMRYEAALAAGSIAEQESVPNVAALLRDEDAEVQEAAIAALGQIGGQGAKEALDDLLEEGDDRVREATVAALDEVDFAQDPLAFKVMS